MANLITYFDPTTANVHAAVKFLRQQADNLDLDLSHVRDWVTKVPNLDGDLRTLLSCAAQGTLKTLANLDEVLAAIEPNNTMRGITNEKAK